MTRGIIADITELSEENYENIYQLLDQSRKNIVDSYILERDRRLSAMSEFCLYYLVSLECSYDKDLFVKAYSSNGKPYLSNIPELFFSVSHSGTKCIVCISQECEIGVDIESLSRYKDSNLKEEVINIFDKDEVSLIEFGEDYLERVLVLWTKKEALFKSLGIGTLRQILKQKLTTQRLNEIESFIRDKYVVSIANAFLSDTILETRNIGIEKMIEQVKTWKLKPINRSKK